MNNIVTISDKDYLAKALTLYESLKETQKSDFCLYLVCLDDVALELARSINEPTIQAIPIQEMEEDNFELRALRYAPPSPEAVSNGESQGKDPRYIQFCWALASYSCWYLLNRRKLDHVFYADSDLYFYKDMSGIWDEIDQKSVGIVRHRIDYLYTSGEYNVGLVFFKNDYYGKRCNDWWRKVLMNPQNPWSAGYGQCGDQKYLELFPAIFGSENVCIIDENIGHLAPWSATFHEYKDEKIIWENREQDLYFFHFAHFVPNIEKNSYKTSYNNEWIWGEPEKVHDRMKHLYDEYFEATKQTTKKYLGGLNDN